MKKSYKIICLSFFIWGWSIQGFAQAFITTWITTNAQITIPTTGTGYNYNITWTNLTNVGVGNGSATGQTGNYTITGLENGSTYQVAITGNFPRFYMNNNASERAKLRTIAQWGSIAWTSMNNAFFGCNNLTYTATDTPNLSGVTDLSSMFMLCTSFNGNIGAWNVSTITNMRAMFQSATVFNQNISSWNVSNVTNMSNVFFGAAAFNQNISTWNIANATDLSRMFADAYAFNQNIGSWNTANVTDMSYMFYSATSFNQNIGGWNTANVTNMSYMFYNAQVFNQNISGWSTANVTNMSFMFYNALVFNQNIGGWNVTNVTNMRSMFQAAMAFNQNIGSWNVSNVTNMRNMFFTAMAFNQNISSWNTTNVTDMALLFADAYAFNQNIGGWNTANVTDMSYMFYNGTVFNQNIGSWNTTNVTNMAFMFYNAPVFNQNISGWNTTNVTNMGSMFQAATAFNQNIGGWNTTNVTNMANMFAGATAFNQNIGGWNVGKVTNMGNMFSGATVFNNNGASMNSWNTGLVTNMTAMFFQASAFNQNIGGWNTTNVTSMNNMFQGATAFNQNIGSWNTGAVTNMNSMFAGATAFNQNIGSWNVANVTNMNSMFSGANTFNQNIGSWNVSNVADMSGMFFQASAFNRSLGTWQLKSNVNLSLMLNASGMNTANYEATLAGWAGQAVTGRSLGASGLQYCVTTNRNTLTVGKSWTITGDANVCPADAFVTTWITATNTITIPTTGTGYNYNITWINLTNTGVGNGSATGQTGNYTITGLENGSTYQIAISGTFPRFFMNNSSNERSKLRTIAQWGNIAWTSMNSAFYGCSNLTYTATDVPNLSGVTDMTSMFQNCSLFNGNIGNWNTSTITNMWGVFSGATTFNQNIGSWNVSNVTVMQDMFANAQAFNQNINGWNTSLVNNIRGMFFQATNFNQNLNSWNTSAVTNMIYMFYGATNFNGNISSWNTSAVTNMGYMFQLAMAFNQNIGGWNVGNVTNMQSMFHDARAFNQNINGWNVSNVTNMQSMFQGTNSFKQDLANWNTGSVTNMVNMFYGNTGFNGNITTWNTSNVTNMTAMFLGTTLFNQNISGWNTSSVTNMSDMFNATNSFNQNISTWNTSNVTSMTNMFGNTLLFNQDISAWNTGNVLNMGGMFQNALAFNQNISTWNTSKVTNMEFMFMGARNFNQNLGAWDVRLVTSMVNMLANTNMSIANYDNTLIGWASQVLKPNVTLTSTGLRYCNGQTARNTLTSAPNNWIISGDSYACVPDIVVRGNNITIAHNDLIANAQDHTDFGNFQSNGTLTRTFTIFNRGTNSLNITSLTSSNTTNFAISNITLPASITSNGTLTFDVTFNANTVGIKSANIVINNNDAIKSAYTFAVKGTIIQADADNKRGNALVLNGTQNLSCTGFSALENYTIEAWIRLNNTANQSIIVGTNASGATVSWSHQIRVVNGRFSHYTLGGSTIIIAGNETVVANKWYHIAVCVENNGQVKMYVDGVLQNVGRNTGTLWSGLTRFDIGSNSGSIDVGALARFNGTIDEVRIWNVGRTQTQIRENMHLTLPAHSTGLLAYYQFNETSGNAIDVVNNWNGTIGSIARNLSTVSVGAGKSKTVSIGATGTAGTEVDINHTGFEIDFTNGGTAPNGDLVVYQITSETPYNNLLGANITSCYWLVKNFGTNQSGLSIGNVRFRIPNHNTISGVDETTPSNLKLYKRADNSGDASWGGSAVASASSANNTTKNITFAGGFTSFSEFIISSNNSLLPITLVNLEGKRQDEETVLLTWTTAQEINNKGFEIEMSEDGLAYQKIAFVEGAGSSNSPKHYILNTENENDGYYRLRQIDFDGKFSYSPVVFVEGVNALKVYPNPNKGTFMVSVGKNELDSSARLLNMVGKEVWAGKIKAGKVDTHNLPTGIYFLHTTVVGKTKVTKIVVQH